MRTHGNLNIELDFLPLEGEVQRTDSRMISHNSGIEGLLVFRNNNKGFGNFQGSSEESFTICLSSMPVNGNLIYRRCNK